MNEASKLRYLKEVDYFSAKLEENPSSKVFLPLALAYLRLGKFDEVITVCQSGLDHNPDYIAAKTVMAEAFLGKGLKEEAKGLLIEVATLNKSNYKAHKLLGDIYRAEENFEKALYYYRTALVVSPEDNTLRMLIEELAEVADVKPVVEEQEKSDEVNEEEVNTSEEKIEKKNEELLNEAETLSEELQGTELLELDFDEIDSKIKNYIENNQQEEAISYVKDVLADYPDILSEKISFIENSLEKTIEVEIPDLENDFLMSNSAQEDIDDKLSGLIEDDSSPSDIELENNIFEDIDTNDVVTDKSSKQNSIDNENKNTDNTLTDIINTDEGKTAFSESVTEDDIFGDIDSTNDTEKTEFLNEKNDIIGDELPDLSTETDNLINQLDEKSDEDTELDIDEKINQKLADLGLEEEKNENEEIINELEGWLQNINKLKSKKNV